jgi:ABC-type Fe3+/spermidine/putrescine transport system ATPase subunit
MIQVHLEDVTKTFGKTTAVERISFTARGGELLTLLGPSGCGKTTILRLIAGFELPDGGDILFDGESVLRVPPETRRVGMVFQNYALFPHMNVRQNISYGLRFRFGGDQRARVQMLHALLGLVGLEKRYPAELSAGQQQRVALARVLAVEPRLLLLDEPLSALDAKLRETLRLEIRRIHEKLHLSTIYVTHDQEEALTLSDRIVVMSTGRVEQIGTPKTVYEKPETLFVASFIGSANRLEGEVTHVAAGRVYVRVGALVFEIASYTQAWDPGTRITFFLKEERLGFTASETNRIPARVNTLEYRGQSIVLHVETPIGLLRARMDPIQANGISPMDEIILGFSPKAISLFRTPP